MAPIKTFALLALGALVERAVCVPQAEGMGWAAVHATAAGTLMI